MQKWIGSDPTALPVSGDGGAVPPPGGVSQEYGGGLGRADDGPRGCCSMRGRVSVSKPSSGGGNVGYAWRCGGTGRACAPQVGAPSDNRCADEPAAAWSTSW